MFAGASSQCLDDGIPCLLRSLSRWRSSARFSLPFSLDGSTLPSGQPAAETANATPAGSTGGRKLRTAASSYGNVSVSSCSRSDQVTNRQPVIVLPRPRPDVGRPLVALGPLWTYGGSASQCRRGSSPRTDPKRLGKAGFPSRCRSPDLPGRANRYLASRNGRFLEPPRLNRF